MAVAQQQGERWSTQSVPLQGGLFLDKDVLEQGTSQPGSAIQLTNFEPSLDGGYHRILGYQPFDTNQLPNGAETVWGTVVSQFEDSVIAMQSGKTYRSSGSGWTKISGTDTHSAMSYVQHTNYSWATNRFAFVDGDPNAYPVRIEAGGTYTVLTNAPQGQKFIQEFSGYLWMSSGNSTLTFSAPNNDNDYNAIDGAGAINLGFNIVGIAEWRGALYVFGNQKISQITGTSAADWSVTPLTDNIGMTGTYSLQEVNGDLVFMSDDGLRTISGTARIFDRELGVISRPIATLVTQMGGANLISTTVRTKSQYRLFQGTSDSNQGTAQGIIGTLKLEPSGSVAWEWSTSLGILVSSADTGLFNGAELTVHGGFDGYVYAQETGTTFNGTAIQATYQTPFLTFNDPNVRKILQKLIAFFRTEGVCTVSVGTVYDYGGTSSLDPPNTSIMLGGGVSTWDDDETWDESGIFWDTVPGVRGQSYLTGSGFTISLIFNSNGGPDYSLQGFSIVYGQGARR